MTDCRQLFPHRNHQLIDEKSRVLDVGCGDGILMEYLLKNKVVDVRGLEISKEKVKKCLSNGLFHRTLVLCT